MSTIVQLVQEFIHRSIVSAQQGRVLMRRFGGEREREVIIIRIQFHELFGDFQLFVKIR